ncbi:cyanate lyase C-terminal domain-containing protein [Lipomyces japonicus]|uniref:cyanate lyase C-terminal domain-containing protein n=1 Tax=Lipomyces japonicus TaxID=56871 RepID=UPI0034CD3048
MYVLQLELTSIVFLLTSNNLGFKLAFISTLPAAHQALFKAKIEKGLSFADLAAKVGRSETWLAAAFYGNMPFAEEDITALSKVLEIDSAVLLSVSPEVNFQPDRSRNVEMPPKDPTIYRLYEIVLVYGYAFKSIIAEKFGDGIMSAICFTSKIEKEVDNDGTWVKITLRGKFLPYIKY